MFFSPSLKPCCVLSLQSCFIPLGPGCMKSHTPVDLFSGRAALSLSLWFPNRPVIIVIITVLDLYFIFLCK